ncbi:MAG TPA: VOC family protein [Solirubrobacteraceae bacterium]|nr:VOC family protein [Solirubrobacteraceae bacterium]
MTTTLRTNRPAITKEAAMSIEYVFAGMAVTRLDVAMQWYERLLGRPPDMRPNEREATWQVAQTASVYLVADDDRAGRSAVTMFVDDLDAELDAITRRGISVGQIETAPGLFRRVMISDPDGNAIQLAELPGDRD